MSETTLAISSALNSHLEGINDLSAIVFRYFLSESFVVLEILKATITYNLQELKHFRLLYDKLFKPSSEITDMVYQMALIYGHEDILFDAEFSNEDRLIESASKMQNKRAIERMLQSFDNERLENLLINGHRDIFINDSSIIVEMIRLKRLETPNIRSLSQILPRLTVAPLRVYLTITVFKVDPPEIYHN